MFSKVRKFFEKYERRISTLALILGFIFDFLTLTRIDRLYDNLVLSSYLCIVSLGIFIYNYIESRGARNKLFKNLHAFLPAVVQFAFGGLFSGISIFYLRSATLSVNIIFVIVLFGLLIGNESFRQKYQKLTFQLTIFYFVLYSYLIFSLPVFLKSIGAGVFVLSGVASLIVMSGIFIWFRKFLKGRFEESKKSLFLTVGAIFVVINLLYFLNVIPPIPLSLKSMDAYHLVFKRGADYVALKEDHFFNPLDTISIVSGKPVYVFSSVFSPTDLDTETFHNWQYFDENKDRWVSTDRILIEIEGGRGDGFKGYTFKQNIFPGSWRVDIETARGQLIGRETFRIKYVDVAPELQEVIL